MNSVDWFGLLFVCPVWLVGFWFLEPHDPMVLNRLVTTHFDLELIGLNPIPNESVLHLHLLDL